MYVNANYTPVKFVVSGVLVGGRTKDVGPAGRKTGGGVVMLTNDG